MRIYSSIILFILCSPHLEADSIKDELAKAESFIEEGKLQQATDTYQSLYNEGIQSKEMLFNWGTAFYVMEEYPKAILVYERLLKKWPNYKKAKHNLALVRDENASDILPLPEFFLTHWWKNIAQFFPPFLWWSFLLASLGMAAYNYYRVALHNKKRSALWFNVLFLGMALLFFFLAKQSHSLRNNFNHVLNLEKCDFRSEPNMTSDIIILPPAEKAKILKDVDIWYQVELSNKDVGWILKKDVSRI